MRISKILIPLASLGLLTSCDPAVFDSLADSTWVHSGAKPGDLDSGGYGTGLIGASSGSGDLHYIITALEPAAIILAKFDKKGNRSTIVKLVRDTIASGLDPLTTPSVIASDPAGFSGARGNVAVAVFSTDNGASLFMVRGENAEVTAPFNLPSTNGESITGIAFGASDASAATDIFAVAGNTMNVIPDYAEGGTGATALHCLLSGTAAGVAVADIDVAAESEVLFSVAGSVSVATGAAILADADDSLDPNNCFGTTPVLATIAAPGGEASFGSTILSGDFDGNGETDLVIAAPAENAVYVFMNWTVAAPSTGTQIATPSGAKAFGTNISIGDFNSDGNDELVISDSQHDVDGKSQAGIVYIYDETFASPIELHDASPEQDQNFGQALTVAKGFGGDSLIVGANNEVFTYFRTPVSGDGDSRE